MKKWMTVLLSGLLLVGACFGFAACGEDNLKGFDIDLAREVAKDLGVEVKFQKIEWSAKFTELETKNIDLIWNGMTITDEVSDKTCVSLAYMKNEQVAVVKKENVTRFATADAIKTANAKLAAESGSAGQGVIEEQFAGMTAASVDSQAMALTEVMSGSSDVAIIDSVMAGYYTSTGDYKDRLVVVPDLVFSEEEYGIAARKADTGIIDKVNLSLKKLYANGTVKRVADTYGLADSLLPASAFENYTSTGATAGWDYIESKGTIVVGYTLFAPIAFE